MNNQFIGNSFCLMNIDITVEVSRMFNLPIWYIPMTTISRSKNRDDSNMVNYRLGSRNVELSELMQNLYGKEESDLPIIVDYLRKSHVDLKVVGSEDQKKDGRYKISEHSFFNHKERTHYFSGVSEVLKNSGPQIVFIDPDTGIAPLNQEVSRTKGSSLVSLSELNQLLNSIPDDSVVIVRQSMNNYFYNQETRIRDLQKELQLNVISVVDEIIQSGVFIMTRSVGVGKKIVTGLEQYLVDYKTMKGANRICLGYTEDTNIIMKSVSLLEKE